VFGFSFNSNFFPVHIINNTNIITDVYMSTPNLPLRYQMITTASTPQITLNQICNSIISEGGVNNTALISSYGSDEIGTGGTITNDYILIALRLKSTHIGGVVKLLKVSGLLTSGTDEGRIRVYFNGTPSSALSYTGINDTSVEIAEGNGSITLSSGFQIDEFFISSANNNNGTFTAKTNSSNNNISPGAAIDGTRDVFYITYNPLSGTADIYANIQFGEFVV
jgi:hypothetical protein